MHKVSPEIDIRKIAPRDIEAESFRIIERELTSRDHPVLATLTPEEFGVVRRCIHATGDFSFADTMRFHPRAVTAGLAAIRAGKNILVDVNMAAAGISVALLERFGGRVICRIGEPETADLARSKNLTRSEAAFLRASRDNIGIVAIGNAPTALLQTMEMIHTGLFEPDLVIGVPVGFVNALESKEILARKPYPHITALGRKGGTPVAVASVNALLRLA
ncbi:precorrin-8X methylmutase [Desulfolithobacter sp.]